MSYQVLARKWRPHNFSEVVGQEHVVKALVNALEHDRLHHAYLFTGTRGVGKTTIARILAKALNCEARKGFDPCGLCASCGEIDGGRFVDLIEVDAASRTKVEDTRDLLENVQYAPNRGRYKVYLIDEVHMLSGHSFNALLKTLEEPPPHVKFLLATTDPQKIPVTVLSRCLQFNLKRLLPDQIYRQMAFILEQEQIEYEAPALRLLARAADGSMRDGLSLLDQAIVHGGGRIGEDQTAAMLGSVDRRHAEELLAALAEGDGSVILNKIAALAEGLPDYADVLRQLLGMLHRIAVAQTVPGVAEAEENPELIRKLAQKMAPEDVQLYYQSGLIGQRDLALAPDPRSGLEMVLLRMLAFRPAPAAETMPAVNTAKPALRPVAAPIRSPIRDRIAEECPIPESPAPAAPLGDSSGWPAIVNAMGIGGMARELAHNCVLHSIDDKICTLLLDPKQQQVRTQRVEETLQQALQAYYKRPLKLVIKVEKSAQETPAMHLERRRRERQKAAEAAIETDENVLALKKTFDARVVPGSVEPIEQ